MWPAPLGRGARLLYGLGGWRTTSRAAASVSVLSIGVAIAAAPATRGNPAGAVPAV